MKVIMINGSPKKNGNTAIALKEIGDRLLLNGIEYEIINVGDNVIAGCKGCSACRKLGKCIIDNDLVNESVAKIYDADALIVASPVYYASLNGTLKCFLDRVFYSKKSFAGKPAAAVAVARRAGTTATLDIINKYFAISNMPIVTSSYWNLIHGRVPGDAEKDAEGLQTMRILADNIAWILKCIEAGKEKGIALPEYEPKILTNFIRE